MGLWSKLGAYCVVLSTQSSESDYDTIPAAKKAGRGIALPTAHLLGLAPLDVWFKMLKHGNGVKPKYWLRMGFILVTSFVGTIATVHERLIMSVYWRICRDRINRFEHEFDHEPGTVVIVGYYRSGTTHLHNLMSCDEQFVTPKWYQCLGGQGFWFGWSVIRFLLVPFLGHNRPQDAVGFGPSWPAEDDFALASWGGCSSIPGRFIWPSRWDDWKRWHTLEGLSDDELGRWRRLTRLFVWKLTRGRNKEKIVLLKTPSHTARIAELDRLFDGRVRFVHLVREPQAVIDSNVRMHGALSGHLLEDRPSVQSVRERIVEEYAYSETKCMQELEGIDPDRWTRVRYQDLRNDGIGTVRSIYTALGLKTTPIQERSMGAYIGQLGSYTSSSEKTATGDRTAYEIAQCDEMTRRYGLDEPSVAVQAAPKVEERAVRATRGVVAGLVCTLVCILMWIGFVWGIHELWDGAKMRLVPLVWVCGAVVGLAIHRASGNGNRKLGAFAAVLTVILVISVAFPITVINYNWAQGDGTRAWIYHNAKGGYEGLRSVSSVVLIILGAVTAYRHGSKQGPYSPAETMKADSVRVEG
jgi:omega-hydroxy-beta-dihydromenaquinone-9 sulfotransferase